jgi:hypothetical protein
MENFTQNRVDMLLAQLDNFRAYVDQKLDEISTALDDLDSRINNLR